MSLRIGTAMVALIGLGLFTMSLATNMSDLVTPVDRETLPRFTAYGEIGAVEAEAADPELLLLVIRELDEAVAYESPWLDEGAFYGCCPISVSPPFRASIEENFADERSNEEAGI